MSMGVNTKLQWVVWVRGDKILRATLWNLTGDLIVATMRQKDVNMYVKRSSLKRPVEDKWLIAEGQYFSEMITGTYNWNWKSNS